ncbi:unnamed protein product, partial [Prorocentrum cordatum]
AAGTGQRCARCGHAHASFTFFCESCGGVMQGEHGAVTHFELLGVPARFDLDLAAADSAFKELQKRLHPDRHAQFLLLCSLWQWRDDCADFWEFRAGRGHRCGARAGRGPLGQAERGNGR